MIYRLYFLQSVKGNWFLQVIRGKKRLIFKRSYTSLKPLTKSQL